VPPPLFSLISPILGPNREALKDADTLKVRLADGGKLVIGHNSNKHHLSIGGTNTKCPETESLMSNGAPAHGLPALGVSPRRANSRWLRSELKTILRNPESRKIFYFLVLNISYMLIQMLYGVWTNSLGLISDGANRFTSGDDKFLRVPFNQQSIWRLIVWL
jgi:hypothetical protein